MVARVASRVEELDTISVVIDFLSKALTSALSPRNPKDRRMVVEQQSNVAWVARNRQLEGESVTDFPLIGFRLITFENSPDYRRNQQALYNGLYKRSGTVDGRMVHWKLQDKRMTFKVLFQTDSEEDLREFMSRLNYRQRETQAYANLGGIRLPIKVILDEGYRVPEQESGIAGNLFTIQTTAVVYFFSGEKETMPDARNAQIDVFVGPKDGQPLLEEVLTVKRLPNGKKAFG